MSAPRPRFEKIFERVEKKRHLKVNKNGPHASAQLNHRLAMVFLLHRVPFDLGFQSGKKTGSLYIFLS